jgi:hypothetical protein
MSPFPMRQIQMLSDALYGGMLAGQDVQGHVFPLARVPTLLASELSKNPDVICYRRQEIEIVEHPRSCYVVGRSGTG